MARRLRPAVAALRESGFIHLVAIMLMLAIVLLHLLATREVLLATQMALDGPVF